MKVLVLGGTGRLGAPVVEHLLAAGHQARVGVRSGDAAGTDPGAEQVSLDVLDARSVESAIAGCDAVHVSVSGAAEGPAVEHAVAAAKRADVELVSYISGTATFPENADAFGVGTKLDCEQLVRSSGMRLLILCPSFAMELLPMHVQRGRVIYFGRQPHPFHWLAADDLGRYLAAAYETDAALDRRLFVWGPEALSIQDALRRYCAALDPEIGEPRSIPFWFGRALGSITRDESLKLAVAVYEMYEQVGGDGGDPAETYELLGRPQTTLETWVDRRRRAN